MKCKACKAYGVNHLGFRGCLIGHAMEDLADGSDGCKRRENTITKEVATVKVEDPRAKYYRWLNEKEG